LARAAGATRRFPPAARLSSLHSARPSPARSVPVALFGASGRRYAANISGRRPSRRSPTSLCREGGGERSGRGFGARRSLRWPAIKSWREYSPPSNCLEIFAARRRLAPESAPCTPRSRGRVIPRIVPTHRILICHDKYWSSTRSRARARAVRMYCLRDWRHAYSPRAAS
jgi:hypothetical protein